jgi:SecD/SecF fusion protein
MQMNHRGTKLWKRITSLNIGNPIAISMDNKIYSAPVVNCEIPNGASQISGNFSKEEADDLVNALSAGSLPTTVKITEETIVGPTLSKVAQKQGLLSVLIGLFFTFIFLIVFYAKSGFVANIALLFNCLFLIGTLVQCGVVMTLSGIAGIVLTIGMAIDANVLINERIKEELRKKDVYEAVSLGYRRAGWTIFDANITTFVTGLILFLCGRGVIRGFATTLMAGIATSFFTSFFLTKYLFNRKIENDSLDNMTFSWRKNKNLFANINFGFVKFRKFAYLLSLSIIGIGFAFLFSQGGLKMGVDFTGGRGYVVKMEKTVNPESLRAKLCELTKENVEVKTYGADNILKIQTSYKLIGEEQDSDVSINNEIMDFISQATGLEKSSNDELKENSFSLVSSSKVEPSIANDFKKSAQRSILFSLLAIFVYIFFRFFSWQFGLVSLIGLAHDVLMTFAAFGFLKFFGYAIEIDQVIIGAILTIIGYSVNSTVVVLSRIKENLKNHKLLKDNVDASINETLSRTLITSLTTIAIVVVLLIFGGEGLRNFALTLFLGVSFGTYSSIFVATPLLKDLYGKNFLCSKLKV